MTPPLRFGPSAPRPDTSAVALAQFDAEWVVLYAGPVAGDPLLLSCHAALARWDGVVGALAAPRVAFEAALRQAVPAEYRPGGVFKSRRSWQLATRFAQASWVAEPDREPDGAACAHRLALSLKLHGALAHRFATEAVAVAPDLRAALAGHPGESPVESSFPLTELVGWP